MRLRYPDPPLGDEGVLLRPWSLADLPSVAEAAGDAYIRAMSSLPESYDDGEGRAWIRRQRARLPEGEGLSLAIDGRDGRAAGAAFLIVRRPGYAGIGYWVLESRRGEGLARRAVPVLARWAVSEGGVRRLEALIEPWNDPSHRVIAAAGFTREGLLRGYVALGGREADAVVYSLFAADAA